MHLHELGHVELGAPKNLHLADVHVLERVDASAHLLDLLADHFRDELEDSLLEVAGDDLAVDDLVHLLANLADLAGLGVASTLGLVHAALGETEAEHAEGELVGGLHVDEGLDEREPLAHEGAKLVGGEVHTGELGEHVGALDVLALEEHLAEGLVLVLFRFGGEGKVRSVSRPGVKKMMHRLFAVAQ